MIEARAVSHRTAATTLIEDISLSAKAGDLVALVGPNGAGKSTLLRILSGEIVPTAGSVRMAGRALSGWSIRERARMRSVLTQHSDLSFAFTAFEVVLLGRSPHIDDRETLRDRTIARLALSATDSVLFADRSYLTLSGGERQRVQTARAVGQIWEGPDFRALLLDEPTSSLDVAHQHGVLRLARCMADDGCAVICVLHDLNLAAQYADTIAVLHRGRLHALGPAAQTITPALLADVFEVDALVVPHPELSCPLVVPKGPRSNRPSSMRTFDEKRSALASLGGIR